MEKSSPIRPCWVASAIMSRRTKSNVVMLDMALRNPHAALETNVGIDFHGSRQDDRIMPRRMYLS
jgi:hypothetical protein